MQEIATQPTNTHLRLRPEGFTLRMLERRSARAAIFRSDATIDGCWCATKPGNEDIALTIAAFPLKIDAKSII